MLVDYRSGVKMLFFTVLENCKNHIQGEDTISNYVGQVIKLATQLNLDLIRCVESSKRLYSAESISLWYLKATYFEYWGSHAWGDFNQRVVGSELRLKQTSHMLRKYIWGKS